MSVPDAIAAVLLVTGASFVFLATAGLWRFDDLFSRIHAATKATTLGVLLVVAAAALRIETPADLVKLLLAAVLQLLTAPVSGHLLGRAAYRSGTPLTRHTLVDQLRAADAEPEPALQPEPEPEPEPER